MAKKWMSKIMAFGGVLLLLSKAKFLILPLLKILKIPTIFSAILMIWTYSMFYGWKFAVGFVYALVIHEMGHLYAARKLKIAHSNAIFIPFMGALIAIKEPIKNAKDEAFLAIMGPVFGLLSLLPFAALYWYSGDSFFLFMIYFAALVNLFNLLPFTPLDGGRIMAAFDRKFWIIGFIIACFAVYYMQSIMLIFIMILGLASIWSEIIREKSAPIILEKIEKVSNDYGLIQENVAGHWGNFVQTRSEFTALWEEAEAKYPLFSFKEQVKSNVKLQLNELRDLLDIAPNPPLYENVCVATEEHEGSTDATENEQSSVRSWVEEWQLWEQEWGSEVERVVKENKRFLTYYNVSEGVRWMYFLLYLLTAALLGSIAFFSYTTFLTLAEQIPF
ncbi:MAG: site-2 protease family protein [Bacilli bacterium]